MPGRTIVPPLIRIGPRLIATTILTPHEQQQHALDSLQDFDLFAFLCGRQSGKTTLLSQISVTEFMRAKAKIIYTAPSANQTRAYFHPIMSALLPLEAAGMVHINRGERLITWPGTDAMIWARTANNVNSIRGENCDYLIADECVLLDPSIWLEVGPAMLGVRDGKFICTSTPPSVLERSQLRLEHHTYWMDLMEKAQSDPDWLYMNFPTRTNPGITESAYGKLISRMSSLAIRQEIYAEWIREHPRSLWKQDMIRERPCPPIEEFVRIIVGVDPSGTKRGDEAGVVAAGLLPDGTAQVIEDNSDRMSPNEWATEAVSTYHRLEADLIVAEVNFGGDMVDRHYRGSGPPRASRGGPRVTREVGPRRPRRGEIRTEEGLPLARPAGPGAGAVALEPHQHLVARTDRRRGVRPHRPADPRRRPACHRMKGNTGFLFPFSDSVWIKTRDGDPFVRQVFDRHYSRSHYARQLTLNPTTLRRQDGSDALVLRTITDLLILATKFRMDLPSRGSDL